MNAAVIERIEISATHLEALVRVDPERMRTSASEQLTERARALLPGLARHTCENDAGRPFTSELRDTETAHLLEHVTCEIMALAGSPRTLKAETAWDFARDGQGVFHIRLEYDDDLVALGAMKYAAEVVCWLFEGGDAPEIDAMVSGLRTLRTV